MTAVHLSARILGTDGFDVDVLHNLVRFYRRLRTHLVIARDPGPADVLVIQRPQDRALYLRSYRAVHVWDYVGSPVAELVGGSAGAERMTVFTTSVARADQLRAAASHSGARIVVLPPPVDVDLWRAPLRRPSQHVVHVGNFKPYYADGSDLYADRFLAAVRTQAAPVWGVGWPTEHIDVRGRLAQFSVSGRYARSTFAFGMMYPFQRNLSFSGRFWHAPINGCRLLSEPSVYSGSWPGVVETDYTADDVGAVLAAPVRRDVVRDEALTFWRQHWDDSLAHVAESLQTLAPAARTRSSVVEVAATNGRLLVHRVRR